MANSSIPFNKSETNPDAMQYMMQAIERGHLSGDGYFTAKCSALLEQTLGAPKALLTTSCTHALEMSAILLNIQPGDEVIIPTFTFVSTANAFVLRGAKPVFIDSRADTLNMDERHLESLITEKTKAIVPVHYGGVGCEMDSILDVARHYNLAVVEDNAHGIFGKYRNQNLGTFGELATQSFHETKNISCGEGGALIINDESLAERAEILREKGTNRSRFFRGLVDKYSWVDVGSSYLPSDLLAAFLLAQLEGSSDIQNKRRYIWRSYFTQLRDWARAHDVALPAVPAHCEQSWHLFYMIMPSLKLRQGLIAHLKAQGIASAFHYVPLHTSEMGQKFGGKVGQCPIAEDRSERLLRLPFYNSLRDEEIERIVQAVLQFDFKKHS